MKRTITIGATLAAAEATAPNLRLLKEMGFEDLDLFFWERMDGADLPLLADRAAEAGLRVSCLSIFGNPLLDNEKGRTVASCWRRLASEAGLFGDPYVSGFAGRVEGAGVRESIPAWKAFFSDLLDSTSCKGLLFENCRMGDVWKRGRWNIAINPDAWSLMFEALDDPRLGLQWEPAHQVEAFAEPEGQLREWMGKIRSVHGKDARLDRAVLARHGLYGAAKPFSPALPGEGDTDWAAIARILLENGYEGSIDLEFQSEPFIPNLERAVRSLHLLESFLGQAVPSGQKGSNRLSFAKSGE